MPQQSVDATASSHYQPKGVSEGQLGILVRYADDLVAMCRTASAAREALRRLGLVIDRLGLTLHPLKTRIVDLRR